MALTAKRRRFRDEFLVDLNATKAAIRAGYSERTASQIGYELLRDPEVQAAIEAAAAERSRRTGITVDRVVEELARLGFSDIRKIVRWQSNILTEIDDPDVIGGITTLHVNDVELVNSRDLEDADAAAIAEVSKGKDGALKVKMHNKQRPLVELLKHLKPREGGKGAAKPKADPAVPMPPPEDDDFGDLPTGKTLN